MKPTLIVCAVEFSPEGRAVLAMALRLARWYAADLHVGYLGSRMRSQNKSVAARAVDHELSARTGRSTLSHGGSDLPRRRVELCAWVLPRADSGCSPAYAG